MRGRFLIVGGGNMGLAIARVFQPLPVVVITRTAEQARFITENYGIESRESIVPPEQHDMIILAVKPKDADSALDSIAPMMNEDSLFISVMAGVSIDRLIAKIPTKNVIRAIPNIPSTVKRGITVFCVHKDLPIRKKVDFRESFERLGKVLEVKTEDQLDGATAIAGSGPAYLFYLAEAMQKAAQELGIPGEDADLMVRHTLAVTGKFLLEFEQPPDQLRSMISSPGGTTQAACDYFDSKQMQEIIVRGCRAAYERAKEISQK